MGSSAAVWNGVQYCIQRVRAWAPNSELQLVCRLPSRPEGGGGVTGHGSGQRRLFQ